LPFLPCYRRSCANHKINLQCLQTPTHSLMKLIAFPG
jgi:hypothetical protein